MKKRIVILDDDEDTLEVMSDILQDEGFEVHRRDRRFEDLVEVERLAPDLMLLDVFFGLQQEGWEFLQRLKAHPPTASIPLILCTASRLTSEQEGMTQQHRVCVLYKPFELNELTYLVNHLLGFSLRPLEGSVQAE